MSVISLLASLFFLLLQPVEPYRSMVTGHPINNQNEEELKLTSEQIKETFVLLFNKRISTLYPLMTANAINNAIFASVIIKMIVDTMKNIDAMGNQEKTSKALLCMIGAGSGEIIGSLFFGRITDRCSNNQIVLINVVTTTAGYAFLILYAVVYDFSFYLAILMTFFFGVEDAGINCLLNTVLGF